MSQFGLSIACLVVSVLGVIINIPSAHVAIFQLRKLRAKEQMTEARWKAWVSLITLPLCLMLLAFGIFLLFYHPHQNSVASGPQSSSSLGTQVQPSPPQQPSPNTVRPERPILSAQSPTKTQSPASTPGVSIAAPVTQSTNAPCSGNSVTGNVDNTDCVAGYVPPPARVMARTGRDAALVVLRTAPHGSSVYFQIVGGSDEIQAFERQIENLFTNAGWTIAGRDFIGSLSVVSVGPNGPISSHGEGLHCMAGASTRSAEVALEAMKLAGFPCASGNFGSNRTAVDLYIQVGSRISPQD